MVIRSMTTNPSTMKKFSSYTEVNIVHLYLLLVTTIWLANNSVHFIKSM